MNKTSIEWVKNPDGSQGYTWNPITGCLNHGNGLCKGGGFPCCAYKLANGRLKPLYLVNTNVAPNAKGGVAKLSIAGQTATEREGDYANPFYPRFWEDRIRELERGIDSPDYQKYIRQSPKGIFVCDMGDLFGIGVPESWTARVLDVIGDDSNSMHRFYLLTKQPQNLVKFSPFPDNCWVGVTATQDGNIGHAESFLSRIEAKIKYISIEPMLERMIGVSPAVLKDSGIDWLIIGACTGSMEAMSSLVGRYFNLTLMHWKGNLWTAQPQLGDLQEIVEAADKAGIPVFLKDNLRPLFEPTCEGNNLCAFRWGKYRQELPNGR